ncbi:MAG: flagellar basal body-associated FliL family protein [Thermodesulfobacterium sp.]|nr:flagellar basal body-associated FliL family protein [Thermodesulfobacterium sp.]
MAEETQVEVQEGNQKPKKGSKKKLLLFLISGLLIMILAGVMVLFLTSPKGEEEKEVKKEHHKETFIYAMEPVVVNLFDPTGKRYLQIGLAFELGDKKLEEEVKNNEPKIKDVVISVLSSKTPEEVLQPEAKELIKNELLHKINSALGEEVILNIYITQYIVE